MCCDAWHRGARSGHGLAGGRRGREEGCASGGSHIASYTRVKDCRKDKCRAGRGPGMVLQQEPLPSQSSAVLACMLDPG